jgi:hypothetical protein
MCPDPLTREYFVERDFESGQQYRRQRVTGVAAKLHRRGDPARTVPVHADNIDLRIDDSTQSPQPVHRVHT